MNNTAADFSALKAHAHAMTDEEFFAEAAEIAVEQIGDLQKQVGAVLQLCKDAVERNERSVDLRMLLESLSEIEEDTNG